MCLYVKFISIYTRVLFSHLIPGLLLYPNVDALSAMFLDFSVLCVFYVVSVPLCAKFRIERNVHVHLRQLWYLRHISSMSTSPYS